MFFEELQHKRKAACLWPDEGSRTLKAAHCWVLQCDSWQPGLCQLAGQGQK